LITGPTHWIAVNDNTNWQERFRCRGFSILVLFETDFQKRRNEMKRILLTLAVLALTLSLAGPSFSGDRTDYRSGYGYGCGWGPGGGWSSGNMMGRGGGWGGEHMMDYGRHGRGMGNRSWGPGPNPKALQEMTPDQRTQWDTMRSGYRMETLETRKQLATKQIELDTLWSQPDVDSKKVEKLSGEVAELEAELAKKRDKYLVQCRTQFGNRGWTCPGGW
jgi:Spy/CpxP family protein refolding chaperone